MSEQAAGVDEKIYMLNVLWFIENGGAEKYAEYAAAAAPFVAELGGKMLDGFTPDLALMSNFKDFDSFQVANRLVKHVNLLS